MKTFGIVCLVISALCAFFFVILIGYAMEYGRGISFWFYISGALIGSTFFYGVILYGFGSINEQMRIANYLLLNMHNQNAAPGAQLDQAAVQQAVLFPTSTPVIVPPVPGAGPARPGAE